jgi:hypothetical protein
VREEWPISNAERARVVAQMIEDATSRELLPKDRAIAARVVVAMDAVNMRREASQVQDRGNELRAAASILRDAQRNPKLRKAMRDAMKQAEQDAESSPPQLPSPPEDTSSQS